MGLAYKGLINFMLVWLQQCWRQGDQMQWRNKFPECGTSSCGLAFVWRHGICMAPSILVSWGRRKTYESFFANGYVVCSQALSAAWSCRYCYWAQLRILQPSSAQRNYPEAGDDMVTSSLNIPTTVVHDGKHKIVSTSFLWFFSTSTSTIIHEQHKIISYFHMFFKNMLVYNHHLPPHVYRPYMRLFLRGTSISDGSE